MAFAIGKILRHATNDDKVYNILCAPTHEAYETGLAKTGHNFYAVPHQSFKTWNTKYRSVPSNYHLLKTGNLPIDVEFDFVLSQNKFGQYQVLSQYAQLLNLPLVSLEHTLPVPDWPRSRLEACRNMTGNLNVFISQFSVGKWGFDISNPNVRVLHHGIDTETFSPSDAQKNGAILSVCNDWIKRDWCCGFSIWNRTIKDLPARVFGDTPGLSRPTVNTEELVKEYRECSIFYNTSTISPVPTSLMEAMSCGAACVSTATCMIPDIIKNGYNGFISNDEKELREYLEMLLSDQNLAKTIGNNARKTIETNFNLNQFVTNWNRLFDEANNCVYGEQK